MRKIKKFHASTREQWRTWLAENHDKETSIALVSYKKHTGKPSISHRESMEEAICFGWIDTTIKRIDESKYMRCFVRRNDKSRWSNATLSYAKKLEQQGLMSPAGILRYKEGLQKPVIDHGLPKNPQTPEDLKSALAKDAKAEGFFSKLAPSHKRNYIYWIEKAKRPETRQKRINSVIEMLTKNKKSVF